MSHRVFKISELTRLIASQLVLINRQSAVNLACACRSLKEPALSALWETQSSLCTLMEVLPKETWEVRYAEFFRDLVCGLDLPVRRIQGLNVWSSQFTIVEDPSPEDWSRVQRYASWMRRIRVEELKTLGEETFNKLRLNSPPGGWFPALQDLSWCITTPNLPYADIFFSPHLKKIYIAPAESWNKTEFPPNILPTFTSTISALPTSNLQLLSVRVNDNGKLRSQFIDLASFIVLRCGPSLTVYDSTFPLSDAAANHLIHLPHLRTLCIDGSPPNYSATSSSLVFPSLERLTLGQGAPHGWLSLLERLDGGASTTQVATPSSKVKESLKFLNIEEDSGINIDTSLVSPIQSFRNLVNLSVEVHCNYDHDLGPCAFKLSNDNITKLAMALNQLEFLLLGHPCFENTCSTTVACLLPISAYCAKLEKLEIHFSTTNIVGDFKNIREDPRFKQLRSAPRCPLTRLGVYQTPLTLDEPGFETVAYGMIDIFPSLTFCEGFDKSWNKLSDRIADLQEE